MRIRTVFVIVALLALMTSLSMSQYAARESFDYPVGASLDTLMGTATNGWAGPWHKVTAKQANAMAVADTGFPYADLSYSVSNVGQHLEGLADSNEQRYARPLDKTWPNNAGQVYWISVLMDVKNALDNATWLGVKLYFGDAGEVMMFGKGHGLDKYTVGSGWHGGAGPEVSTISWTAGPVWLVGKIAMQGGASATNDTAYMWINPDPAGGEPSTTPDGVANSKWANGFNTVRVEFGGNISPGGLGLSVDEIRLGTSWTDVSVPLMITGVTPQHNVLPFEFTLSQNYPNPFNPTSNISYTLQNSGRVRLAVYDLLGREVAVLVNSVQNSGSHEVTFSGTGLSSGIYFYRLESSGQAITKKMVLLK